MPCVRTDVCYKASAQAHEQKSKSVAPAWSDHRSGHLAFLQDRTIARDGCKCQSLSGESKPRDCMIAPDIANGCVKTRSNVFLEHIYSRCSSDLSSVMNCFKFEKDLFALLSERVIILMVTWRRKQICDEKSMSQIMHKESMKSRYFRKSQGCLRTGETMTLSSISKYLICAVFLGL